MTPTKPGLLKRAAIALNVFRSGYPRAIKSSPFLWPAFRGGVAQWQITDFNSYITDGYQMNAVIYAAIMFKVRTCAWSVPLRAYTGDPNHPEPLPLDHPLAALAQRPNQYQSIQQFMGSNTVYLNVAGNSYVMLDRPKVGALPTAMYPLRPDRVFIIPDSDRSIKGYLYVPEGHSPRDGIPILTQDMIHVRLPNPLDPLEGMGYGLSPFAAMARSADVDNGVTNYLKIFFQKGAAPNVYLKFDVPMDDATISQVKHRFQEIYGGAEKWADVGVIDQGGSIEAFGQNFKEIGFEVIDERTESRILMPFGVPGVLIGTRLGLNRAINANAKELHQAFWEDTMLPELGLHESEYQYYLRGDDGAYVMFDTSKVPALRKDIATLVAAYTQLFNTGVPRSVAASTVGLELESLPDDLTSYMPLNLIPMSSKPQTTSVTNEATVPDATNPDQQNKARHNGELKIYDLFDEAKDLAIAALQPIAPPAPLVMPAPVFNLYATVQAAPIPNVTVQPAQVTVNPPAIENHFDPSITVQPAEVNPAPIENHFDPNITVQPSTVENKNEITVTPAKVEVVPTPPHTEVTDIERDPQGNITRTVKKTQ